MHTQTQTHTQIKHSLSHPSCLCSLSMMFYQPDHDRPARCPTAPRCLMGLSITNGQYIELTNHNNNKNHQLHFRITTHTYTHVPSAKRRIKFISLVLCIMNVCMCVETNKKRTKRYLFPENLETLKQKIFS